MRYIYSWAYSSTSKEAEPSGNLLKKWWRNGKMTDGVERRERERERERRGKRSNAT